MEFVMIMGLNGSGRESEAQRWGHPVVHTEEEALQLLRGGRSVVLEAPNLRARSRKAFLERIAPLKCKTHIVLTARRLQDCMAQLPECAQSIRSQYLAFYPPQPYEGWERITLRYAPDTAFESVAQLFFGQDGLMFLSQDNPFHKHSVGMHCVRAARITSSLRPDDPTLWLASLLHDIGKAETKSFLDSKGRPSQTAHYYGHEFASAYESLFLRFPTAVDESERLRVSALIVWHMMPHHFAANEKTRARYERLWGRDFLEDMLIIERADREAQQ